MEKKLSVIVPVYNEQELIGGCLDSLNHQSLDREEYEVIVIDNNSTDLSAKIAHDKHVRVESEPQKGYVHAIKKGFDISTTEFVAFTDADCRVPENWVQKILEHFASSEKIVGVGGKVEFYDLPLVFDKSIQLILYINNALPGNNMAVRRDTLAQLGGIDPRINLGVDYWLTLKLRKHGKLKIDRSMLVYTSARRLKHSFDSDIKYFINVLALQVASRPVFYDFPDVRKKVKVTRQIR